MSRRQRFEFTKWFAVVLSGSILFLNLPQAGWAQYPTKPITVVVGYGAGGSTDITARVISEAASKILGQPIVVVNKPGGGSGLALGFLKREEPNGYTIGTFGGGGIISQKMRRVNYDLSKDFTYIMGYGDYQVGVAVQKDAPWKTFVELVGYAKANPGKLKYSTTGTGSSHHMMMEALAKQQGIQWTHIPYKGGHEATVALLGGHVDFEASTTEWKPYVDNGSLRLLTTYSPRRNPKYPEVPTMLDLGYNLFLRSAIGLLGPKGIPGPVVEKLNLAFKQAMGNLEFKKTMDQFDMEIIYYRPEELEKETNKQLEFFGNIIKQLGLRED
jgi:tripartite-type tricarboxylate transporter receptor subunit TctC